MMPSLSLVQTCSRLYFFSSMPRDLSALTFARWVKNASVPTLMICESAAS
jgi:hypothetical protein